MELVQRKREILRIHHAFGDSDNLLGRPQLAQDLKMFTRDIQGGSGRTLPRRWILDNSCRSRSCHFQQPLAPTQQHIPKGLL